MPTDSVSGCFPRNAVDHRFVQLLRAASRLGAIPGGLNMPLDASRVASFTERFERGFDAADRDIALGYSRFIEYEAIKHTTGGAAYELDRRVLPI